MGWTFKSTLHQTRCETERSKQAESWAQLAQYALVTTHLNYVSPLEVPIFGSSSPHIVIGVYLGIVMTERMIDLGFERHGDLEPRKRC